MSKKWPEPESEEPEIEEIIDEVENQGGCHTSCEEMCWTEADGECPHGHPSWLLRWGMI